MADRGAASCVSIPVYLNGVPRGVITFASRDPGVFSRWARVGVRVRVGTTARVRVRASARVGIQVSSPCVTAAH